MNGRKESGFDKVPVFQIGGNWDLEVSSFFIQLKSGHKIG